MNKFIIIILFACCSIGILPKTSAQSFVWANNIAGSDTTLSGTVDKAVATDASNNVYFIGSFKGTLNLGGSNTLTANSGCTDFFIVKYNSSGTFQWVIHGATTIASTKSNFARNIVFDSSGNLFISGMISEPTTFTPASGSVSVSPQTSGTSSGFILKVSSSGSALACIRFAWGSTITSDAITIDQSDNLAISGSYTGALTLYGTASSWPTATSKNQFVVQYSNSFVFNWADIFPGTSSTSKLISICTCPGGGFYTGGFFIGSLTIGGSTLNSVGAEDVAVIKLGNSGNVIWVRQGGSTNSDRCNEVKSDAAGNVYLTGYTLYNSINFDSTGTGLLNSHAFPNLGGYDGFVVKYNPSGTFQWAKFFANSDREIGYGINVKDSTVAVIGVFTSKIIWNDTINESSPYHYDVFLGIMNTDGYFLFSAKAGGVTTTGNYYNTIEDRGERVTFDNSGNIILSGYYYSNPLFFGPDSIIPLGAPDLFLAKFQTMKVSSSVTNVSCNGGGSDGSISLTVTDGTPPYSFLWSNSATTQNISNLSPGTYTVKVQSSNLYRIYHTFVITQNSGSTAPGSASANPSVINIGSSTTLNVSGGNLVSGDNWNWYTGSCGGTYIISGSTPVVTPATSITYWVRAEGTCTPTACVSLSVTVNLNSLPATSASSNPSTICPGSSSTLSTSGGLLVGNANWFWYSGSCGGTYVGTDSSIVVNPALTTLYFVRAEGSSNTTTCISATINVNTSSSPASSASGSPSVICPGNSSTLSLSGGSLGTNAGWMWYTGSCGGTYATSGTSPVVNPAIATTYYVRAEGTCNTTSCVNTTVILYTLSILPNSSSCSPSTICSGSSVTLSVSGGSLGTNASWYWYVNSCTGILSGSTTTTLVRPRTTSYYNYVKAMGTCNTTSCLSNYSTVQTSSTAATSASASPDTICPGASTTLALTGGTLGAGATWFWYSGTCGGTFIANGITATISPTTTTTFYVRAENMCNSTTCVNITVTASGTPVSPPLSATSDKNNYCSNVGGNFTFTASGGTGTYVYWYKVSCGGTFLGSGNPKITPLVAQTTKFYVRWGASCGNSNCISFAITVAPNPTQPTSPSVSNNNFCSNIGGNISLSATGSIASGVIYGWYTGSCGGTNIGATRTITITAPTIATTYWVRGEDSPICNPSACSTIVVTVYSTSSPATTVSASPSSITSGSPSTLSFTGGSLGTGAGWYWYTGSCGGTFVANGTTATVSPTATTTYYLRAEGQCNTTICDSTIITILANASSTAPSSAGASPDTICNGATSTLSFTGGSLGTGASWFWYSVSCGGTFQGNGTTLPVSPSNITTYYVRAEGIANTTTCVSVTVSLYTTSTPATSASANPSVLCSGSPSTLSITGGSLGSDGSIWMWYSVSCGGTYIGSGISTVVSPAVTATFYVRAVGPCGATSCVNTSITVNPSSIAPSSASDSPSSICSGNPSTLGINGGSLSTDGATWNWYTGSCGGTYATSGSSPVVNPFVTTTYYVRAEGTCNTTTCTNATITINTVSTAPSSASASPSALCSGSPSTLSVTGGSLGSDGSVWMWYSVSCGGTYIGSGISTIVNPTITTTYYVMAVGTCFTTSCVNTSITINPSSVASSSASASPAVICTGSSSTLSQAGGSLGPDDAVWMWYTGSCGGTNITSGASPVVNPAVTTVYYVRAQGSCGTTACASTILTVNPLSVVPSSASASPSAICAGSPSTLGITGGSLSTDGATWNWYSGSCGGTYATSGSSPVVNPFVTTTYYVRAEGTCNTTTCTNATITINTVSTAPSSASASPSALCSGSPSTLSVTGGSLGSDGSMWMWYSGSCGGTYIGSGISTVVSPTVTATYYVMAVGTCVTTSCVNTNINVNIISTSPSSATASPSSVIQGSSSTLTSNGGSLGTGASWYWYSVSCGGTFEGNGSTLTVSPSSTTTYYVRAEGTCNTTLCVSIILTVSTNTPSTDPTSASSSPNSICSSGSSTLSFTGGSLGTGASWFWYSGSCGGTFIANGTTLIVSPTVTTTYYVRAEGSANTTNCASTSVTVNINSFAASSANGSPSSICTGSSSTLGITGGSLGSDNAMWMWYSGSCGGTHVTSGTSPVISPAVTTTYYVRAEGTCSMTGCVSTALTVNPLSVVPSSSSANPASVCPGVSSMLGITGGSLSTDGAVWKWYSGSCGGTYVTSGTSPVVTPTATTTYYVRAEGTCNTTTCINTVITLNTLSVAATSASASPSAVCPGASSTLSITGGSLGSDGAIWKWYTGSCGGTYATSGTSPVVSPAITTTYYLRAEGSCYSTNCVNTTVTLNTLSVAPTSASCTPSTVCTGSSATFSVSGGSLGTNAKWFWYINSCGGGSAGSTTNTLVRVRTITYTYYVLAAGTCNTTSCLSTLSTVQTSSTSATSASASSDTICPGALDTLSLSGGTLGSGALWYWYSGSCGGTFIANGTTANIIPTTTTTYYVRAENMCNSTTCVNVTVTATGVLISPPLSVTTSRTSYCSNNATGNITLTSSGGSGSVLDWYKGVSPYVSCSGGTSIGTTSPLIIQAVAQSTRFFVRWESSCGTTTCVSFIITVATNPSQPSAPLASPNPLCSNNGGNISLSASATISTGITCQWYTGSCGGSNIGSTTTLTITAPTITTTYWVRCEDSPICSPSKCSTIVVTVNTTSSPATSLSASPATITSGSPATLSLTGGSLGTGAGWYWYSGSCGGTFVANGTTATVYPTITTTYYLRAEGLCNTTICDSTIVTVNSSKVALFNTIAVNADNSGNDDLYLFPNPANNEINIKYNIENTDLAIIEIFNLLGEKVVEINNKVLLKGTYISNLDISSLPSGMYTCKMTTKNNKLIRRFIISK